MTLQEAIISGVIQGITEFLPVSSSAHLALLHNYLGYKEPQILFDIFLHAGTLFAIFIYFRKDILAIFTKERRILFLVFIGSVPTAIIGFLFKSFFEEAFVHIKLIAGLLLINAFLLFSADLIVRGQTLKNKDIRQCLTPIKALIIGAVQGAAILPGLSRSGTTVSTALICNVKKQEAVRFSFLLAIPAILGAFVFKLKDAGALGSIGIAPVIAGALTAFLIGLAAIYLLIKAVIKDKLYLFGIYCFLIGTIVLFLK